MIVGILTDQEKGIEIETVIESTEIEIANVIKTEIVNETVNGIVTEIVIVTGTGTATSTAIEIVIMIETVHVTAIEITIALM